MNYGKLRRYEQGCRFIMGIYLNAWEETDTCVVQIPGTIGQLVFVQKAR
jgi:hypothetical protein